MYPNYTCLRYIFGFAFLVHFDVSDGARGKSSKSLFKRLKKDEPASLPAPRFPSFPNVRAPDLATELIEQSFKVGQRRVVAFQSLESTKTTNGGAPRTASEVANIESKITLEAKRDSQIAYILEKMTESVVNTSKLSREQIIFGLPKLTVAHPTITRRCPYNVPVSCNITEFRSISGLCNNMQNPYWGVSSTPYSRFMPHNYSDAVRRIRTDNTGRDLPRPRLVSSTVHWSVPGLHPYATQLITAWTQFVEHDLSRTAAYTDSNLTPLDCCNPVMRDHQECLQVDVDPDDSYYDESERVCMNYVRSIIVPKLGCAMGPRDQANAATHFLDASQVYGSTEQDAARLREQEGGRLSMTDFENGKSLLLEATNYKDCRPAKDSEMHCFDAGDPRVNGNLPLTAIYTLMAREHNRLAAELAKLNPHWDDEQLFQTVREIVIAQIQHITFTEYLPLIIGRDGVSRNKLEPVTHGFYHGYSIDVNPGTTNEFATAAFKFWHTIMDNQTQFIDRRGRTSFKPFNTQWFQPYDLYFSGVFDGLIRGSVEQPARAPDQSVTSALLNHWLSVGPVAENLDLVALTLQRGRDHGISSYNAWRDICGVKKATAFEDLADSISASNIELLKSVYGSVNDIDLYTGGLCETPVADGLVGPVFACIIGKQFHNIRRGDRYWYETDMPDSSFSLEQLNEIRTTSLSRIMCENGDKIPSLQARVFLQPDELMNAPMPCRAEFFRPLDLNLWREAAPEDVEIPRDVLLNILERARDQVANSALNELAQVVRQSRKLGTRTAFNSPTAFVRGLHMESSVFLEGTKGILSIQLLHRKPSNASVTLARLHRMNAIVKAKLELPAESDNCTERLAPCDQTSRYRTMSGWCNNLKNPDWGSSERIFRRLMDPAFADAIDEPRNASVTGIALPSTREVQIGVVVDEDRPHPRYTHMLMEFGQFMDHDVTLTPIATALNGFNFNCRACDAKQKVSSNCRPISIPLTDTSMSPFVNGTTERRCLAFIRSASGRTAFGAREQVNQNTAYIDASMVYGSSLCKTKRLRTFSDGLFNTTKQRSGLKDLLPTTMDKNDVEFLECQNILPGNLCFLTGDTRGNENPGLTTMHTSWMRFHNQIATELNQINPSWDDERIFQESRRILIAVFQHITYKEYLPRVLGQAISNAADLNPRKTGYYTEYDPTCDATMANEVAAAALRFGHTLVQGEFGRYDNNFIAGDRTKLRLFENFARSDALYEDYGADQILLGLIHEPMQNMDTIVTKALTDHLFEDRTRKFSGQDLVAINIMRGRDHGVPGYNEFREYCNLTRAADFSDLSTYMPPETAAAIQKVYRHVDDIDLYLGGIAEYSVYGGVVGPTFACMIAEQMARTRRCDRFWYETNDPLLRFSEEQLDNIRKMSLGKVVCETGDTVDHVQRSVFDQSDPYINPYIPCSDLPGLDLTLWRDNGICNFSGLAIPVGRAARVTPCMTCTCTREGPFCQSVAVRNCRTLLNSFHMAALLADDVCRTQCAGLLSLASRDLSAHVSSDLFARFL